MLIEKAKKKKKMNSYVNDGLTQESSVYSLNSAGTTPPQGAYI
jgi:hypothetical protein